MGTDYYMRCNTCKEDIWVAKNYGIKKIYTDIYEREPDEDSEYEAKMKQWSRESLHWLVEFMDKHQGNDHELGYYDDHELVYEQAQEREIQENEESEKKQNLPEVGEIVETISNFVPIRALDSMYWLGDCPFHEDDKSAFIVDRPNQRFNCTKCFANGNVYGFLSLWMEGKKVSLYRPDLKKDETA